MDTPSRSLVLDTTHKRRLTDEISLPFHDDYQPSKYLRVATENPHPVEETADLPRSRGQGQRIAAAHDALYFRRSAVPSRFMYYDKGEWRDYPQDVIPILLEKFLARKGFAKLLINEKEYLMNFIYMLELNLTTGYVRSIAWMDKSGQRLTPSRCIEGSCALSLSLISDLAVEDSKIEAKCGNVLKFSLSPRAESAACTLDNSGCDFTRLGDKLIKLSADNQDFVFMKEKFLTSFSQFANDVTIINIHRNTHNGISGQARLQAFKSHERITAQMRGNANVCYAWHGTSKEGMCSIILHGFGQPSLGKSGGVYGVGVHLTPENLSLSSALNSNVDENGEQHLMLCQVIMGRTELVHANSQQFHPSNEDYDTGVDDAESPKLYVIWNTHMNTHILPLFIVSFKLPNTVRDVMLAAQRGKQALKDSSTCLRHSTSDKKFVTDPRVLAKSDAMRSVYPPDCRVEYATEPAELSAASSIVADNVTIARPSVSRTRRTCARQCHHIIPRSPWIPFAELFSMLESKLKPQALMDLQQLHTDFQAGKLPRNLFVKEVRCLLGDELLRDCIKNRTEPEGSTITFCG